MRLWWVGRDLVVKLCIPSHADPSWSWGGRWQIMKSWWLCDLLIFYGAGSRLVMTMNWMETGGSKICWSDGSLIIWSWFLQESSEIRIMDRLLHIHGDTTPTDLRMSMAGGSTTIEDKNNNDLPPGKTVPFAVISCSGQVLTFTSVISKQYCNVEYSSEMKLILGT